jgi:aerobic carbon-monoxide dehydrogenase medium subunit
LKASNFLYLKPKSLDEALDYLATKEEPRIIAGGQSLVAAMNMKLAQPETIIDIGELDDLKLLKTTSNEVHIGALVSHSEIEFSKNSSKLISFLSKVAKNIAHTPIRFKGTFCGAVANSDPASEWCACLLALDGSVEIIGQDRQRRIVDSKEFFIAPYLTNIGFDEILVSVKFPEIKEHTKLGFNEYARRAGDYAIAMCVSKLNMKDNIVKDGNIVIGAAAETPVIIEKALNFLQGKPLTDKTCWEAAIIASENVRILPDIDSSEEYKQDVVKAVTYRSLLACS